MSGLEILLGGCICGEVCYTARGNLGGGYACHCLDCQTRSGSAFATMLPVAWDTLTFAGTLCEWQQVSSSGEASQTFACAQCFTRLFTRRSIWPGMAVLRAGTLERSREFVARVHLWTRSAQGWIVIPPHVPAFETQPASRDAWKSLQ